jgi:membrane associated rhomboid family serine protease
MIPLYDHAARHRVTDVNTTLVVSNLLIFPVEVYSGHFLWILQRLGLVPYFILHPFAEANRDGLLVYGTLLTSMFLHVGDIHVLLNMYILMIFGPALEDYLGHLRYLLFYGLCGISAGLVAAYLAPASTIPIVGASGAIAGVLGAHLILFPRARLRTVLPLLFTVKFFDVPSVFYLMLWFGLQLLALLKNGALGSPTAGVAWAPHVAGFMFGVMLGPLMARVYAPRRLRTS